ncbi:MAG: bifunctional glutamate N-acetyltransferase/amino-acid acetyltransferase ArgJ, partial [Planifilum fimeticola]
HAGLKKRRRDLGMIFCEVPASAAAVYTMNAFQAAPLKVTRDSLAVEGKLQAVVVNSGNANACTGQRGLEDALKTRREAAKLLGIPEHRVAVASTGVIGEFLPMDRMMEGLARLVKEVGKGGHLPFSESILTTDTCTKEAEVILRVEGRPVRIAGAAKGSGMIHPRMATMLAFLTTDAVIGSRHLQHLLREVTDETFNMITVDGDCSTNDMVLAMASERAGHSPLHPEHPEWAAFKAGFAHVARELAKMIARDGEGATRLVEVKVTGAASRAMARRVAKGVAGSNLVKSAVYGADANWGRVFCAIGYSDPDVKTEAVDLYIGDIPVVRGSRPVSFNEERVQFRIDLHQGIHEAVAWGCDLTYEYVRINACYRT